MYIFPFTDISDKELHDLFKIKQEDYIGDNKELKNLLINSLSEEIVNDLEFKYYTPLQLDSLAAKYKRGLSLSIFHVNIRSLNANHTKLIAFLQCLKFKVDVIILSEVWKTNIEFYTNLMTNYEFIYDLPSENKAGGVGIFVKKELKPKTITNFKMLPTSMNSNLFECVWVEVLVDKTKYYIGGYYRHPNTAISEFNEAMSKTLDKIKNKKRCYIFGDLNLDLSQYGSNNNINISRRHP